VPTPHATLAILYLFAFFLVYCAILIAPALWKVLVSIPPGPEQQAVAEQVARDTLRPRLLFAFLAALASVAVGTWKRILPPAGHTLTGRDPDRWRQLAAPLPTAFTT
jgi:hypothetical protein